MNKLFKWIVALIIAGSIWYGYVIITAPAPSETSAIIIETFDDPYQDNDIEIDDIVLEFEENTVTLEPQAEYEVSALILSRKNYYFEFGAKIMPTDLALGWGDMADEKENIDIKITQSGRWYYYKPGANSVLDGKYISTHSSNHHIIPASINIKKAIGRIEEGQIIKFDGYLVDVATEGTENFDRISSTSRTDKGAGSCEIMYVTKAQIGDKIFQ